MRRAALLARGIASLNDASAASAKRPIRVGIVLIGVVAVIAALWLAREIVLLGFLGVLIAVVFSFPVGWLSRVLPRSLAVIVVLLVLIGGAIGLGLAVAPTLSKELNELQQRGPKAIESLRNYASRAGASGHKIAGIEEWFPLGVLTFLGTFVPSVGAVSSAVPGLLAGLAQSPRHFLWAGIVYLGVHLVEGYLIQPLVMRRAVEVKPALLLFGQGLFSAVFGLMGTVVATPLLVCGQTLIGYLWVERRLRKQPTK